MSNLNFRSVQCTQPDGREEWYQDGRLHRVGGPAIVHADGTQEWYQDGLLHREDGPAVVRPGGYEAWYRYGLLHREDGPASSIHADGTSAG